MSTRILIVEDSLDTRELIKFHLTMEGFDVVTAIDGLEGIEKADSENPGIIITDINMPRLNGVEMIRRLRGNTIFNGVKIVAMTAYGSGPAREAREAGADLVLRKPILFDTLADALRKLVT
jgi:CheY-like chemotaxis protein